MTITAQVIADSISTEGIRLTTFELRYPRFVHAEFMTHRAFSRNASSSRATPVATLIRDVEVDPAMPVFWGKNQKGMQAREELTGWDAECAKAEWLKAKDHAVSAAKQLALIGAHKQIVNRILEPFSHIKVVATATDWANFFVLRRHEDAQPEIKALADAMWSAWQLSLPNSLKPGEWHVPYVGNGKTVFQEDVKVSVARCARVSYLTHDGKGPAKDADLKLYDKLVGSYPLHASPAEHQATPDHKRLWAPPFVSNCNRWERPHLWGNLYGWCQYRKTLVGESVRDR